MDIRIYVRDGIKEKMINVSRMSLFLKGKDIYGITDENYVTDIKRFVDNEKAKEKFDIIIGIIEKASKEEKQAVYIDLDDNVEMMQDGE